MLLYCECASFNIRYKFGKRNLIKSMVPVWGGGKKKCTNITTGVGKFVFFHDTQSRKLTGKDEK